MKKLLGTIKTSLKNIFSNIFLSHYTCSFLLMGVIMLCLMWNFSLRVDHASEKLELQKDKIMLEIELRGYFGHIDEQDDAIQNQREVLEELKTQSAEQNLFIQKIILYLKRIGHWPPKVSPDELGEKPGLEA